jgi:uncharacterized membrane protein YraQ (UPF0718 family)
MGHISRTDPLSGITARYRGGANNYSIQFDFQCDDTLPYGEVQFNQLGNETVNRAIVVYAHTHEVCPDREWGQIMGGSIFLVIVIALVIGYFAIGTLVMYIRGGTVALPNEGFWGEVGDSLAAGAGFFCSCGKGAPAATGTYENI